MSEKKKHGSTSLAYGLCMKYGIKIQPDWKPRDAWNALYREKKITPEQAYDDYGEISAKRSKVMNLPKKEYAEVCSAIRTKYGNKIPTKGDLFNGDYYYIYKYSKQNEQILCTEKIKIDGNEWYISMLQGEDND